MEKSLNFFSHLLLTISYPLGYLFHYHFEDFEIQDSIWIRLGFSLYCIIIYIIIKFNIIEKYKDYLFHFLHTSTLLYTCFLCSQNYLGITYTLGLAVIIGNTLTTNQSLRFLKLYFSLTVIISFFVSFFSNDSLIHPWIFFFAMTTVASFAYQAHSSSLLLISSLERERKRADKANQDKSMFLAKMSHEIRNPLNAIIPIIDFLEQEKNEKARQEYISIIKTSSEHLLEIINDTLDISKIDAGKMEIHPVPCDPYQVAFSCFQLYQIRAQEKGLDFQFNFKGQRSSFLADPYRLRQILVNLLGNAIKFTNQGKVLFELELNVKKNLLHSSFRIYDSGAGIPSDQKENLFQQYYQVKGSDRQNTKGTGLGLYISKILANLMGGNLYFESPPRDFSKTGTIFFLELALPIVEMEAKKMEPATYNPLPIKKVLLIDDDEVNLYVLSRYLSLFQIPYHAEKNPIKAIELTDKEDFSIIIVDIEMPEMSGFEVANTILTKEGNSKNAKFIIISGHDLEGENFPNIAKFLPKPIQKESLYETLKEVSDK